jgi:putative transcriptional regulator
MLCSIYTIFMSRNEEIPVFNRIAQQRELIGMSRQQLAEMVNVHYQTIGYLERGEYSPSLVLALRISEALNLDVQSLFSIKPFSKGLKK